MEVWWLMFSLSVKASNFILAVWNSLIVPQALNYRQAEILPKWFSARFPRVCGLGSEHLKQEWHSSNSNKCLVPFEKISLPEYRLVQVLLDTIRPGDDIVDLGGNQGRFSATLTDVDDVSILNVDVWEEALNVSRQNPRLKALGLRYDVCCQTFESFLASSRDAQFDILFSRGATVELVPNSFPLVFQISRITRRAVVLMIKPMGHYTPRFYSLEFKKYGFVQDLYVPCNDINDGVVLMRFVRIL